MFWIYLFLCPTSKKGCWFNDKYWDECDTLYYKEEIINAFMENLTPIMKD